MTDYTPFHSDLRPKKGGWAPGGYWHTKCNFCGLPFTGDKRAITCAPCAYMLEVKVEPIISSWDKRWMDTCLHLATWSKDRSRKVGCVIVDSRNVLVAQGWNGFPRGIDDTVEARHERPAKYLWTEHSERNALYNAAANGHATLGCTMYVPWYPCADCARALIQSGITKLVCVEPDWKDPTYGADFAVVKEMLTEVGIETYFVSGYLAPVAKELGE